MYRFMRKDCPHCHGNGATTETIINPDNSVTTIAKTCACVKEGASEKEVTGLYEIIEPAKSQ